MKLTREVGNRGAYLSVVVRLLFCLGRLIDPGGPLGPPGRGFRRRVIPWSCQGKRRVACMRVCPGSRAFSGGPHPGNVLFDRVMSRRPERVPSVPARLHGFSSALISHLH